MDTQEPICHAFRGRAERPVADVVGPSHVVDVQWHAAKPSLDSPRYQHVRADHNLLHRKYRTRSICIYFSKTWP